VGFNQARRGFKDYSGYWLAAALASAVLLLCPAGKPGSPHVNLLRLLSSSGGKYSR
jgi:hypothetical protein